MENQFSDLPINGDGEFRDLIAAALLAVAKNDIGPLALLRPDLDLTEFRAGMRARNSGRVRMARALAAFLVGEGIVSGSVRAPDPDGPARVPVDFHWSVLGTDRVLADGTVGGIEFRAEFDRSVDSIDRMERLATDLKGAWVQRGREGARWVGTGIPVDPFPTEWV